MAIFAFNIYSTQVSPHNYHVTPDCAPIKPFRSELWCTPRARSIVQCTLIGLNRRHLILCCLKKVQNAIRNLPKIEHPYALNGSSVYCNAIF